jgi:hypothetical protein
VDEPSPKPEEPEAAPQKPAGRRSLNILPGI